MAEWIAAAKICGECAGVPGLIPAEGKAASLPHSATLPTTREAAGFGFSQSVSIHAAAQHETIIP